MKIQFHFRSIVLLSLLLFATASARRQQPVLTLGNIYSANAFSQRGFEKIREPRNMRLINSQ